jgi:predicted nucleotidyltransferase
MHPVWIFGSRALGTAKKASDLDLAIVGENPLDPLTLANLNNAFSESDLPYKVDVIDFSTVSDGFRTIIQNQHIVLKDPE